MIDQIKERNRPQNFLHGIQLLREIGSNQNANSYEDSRGIGESLASTLADTLEHLGKEVHDIRSAIESTDYRINAALDVHPKLIPLNSRLDNLCGRLNAMDNRISTLIQEQVSTLKRQAA